MLKIFPKYLNFENISKKYIRVRLKGCQNAQSTLKNENLKTTFSWFTVLLFDRNERKMCFFLS